MVQHLEEDMTLTLQMQLRLTQTPTQTLATVTVHRTGTPTAAPSPNLSWQGTTTFSLMKWKHSTNQLDLKACLKTSSYEQYINKLGTTFFISQIFFLVSLCVWVSFFILFFFFVSLFPLFFYQKRNSKFKKNDNNFDFFKYVSTALLPSLV